VPASGLVLELVAEKHETAALRVHEPARGGVSAQLGEQPTVRREPRRVYLRIPAAEVDPARTCGQARVAKRTELDEPRPRARQQLEVLGVVKGERLVARHRDHDLIAGDAACSR
jgi:hypothetical protein